MDQRLAILSRHHRRLREVLTAAKPLLTCGARDADFAGMGYLRHEMIELMTAYRRFVHDDVGTGHAAGAAADAAALRDISVELDRAYAAFRERWAERAIAEHWSEYRLSAIRLMNQMHDAVDRAERLDTGWAAETVTA